MCVESGNPHIARIGHAPAARSDRRRLKAMIGTRVEVTLADGSQLDAAAGGGNYREYLMPGRPAASGS